MTAPPPPMTPAPPATADRFRRRLDDIAERVERRLAVLLGAIPEAGEIARPPRLLEAMRHGVLGGGKRLRPFLVIESAGLFGVPDAHALDAGIAIELIHGYSLVHDDLPAMDNDLLRRGKPTVHVAFDEATAILAGDALLTLAFDVAARAEGIAPGPRCAMIALLARGAGLGGMAGGQMLDLAAEGRFEPEGRPQSLDADGVRRVQAMKTGALIAAAVDMGAAIGAALPADTAALHSYGKAIGFAFQIADDLLDLEASPAETGKATGKDAAAGKATLPALMGVKAARAALAAAIDEAVEALAPFGARAAVLAEAARFIAVRRN